MTKNPFIETHRRTTNTLENFVKFDEVYKLVDEKKVYLEKLNKLLNTQDMKEIVCEIFEACPEAFEVLDLLIAVKDNNLISYKKNNKLQFKETKAFLNSADNIMKYLEETGLYDFFTSGRISNLIDYMYGIQVCYQTHARKNRNGKYMKGLVTKILNKNKISFTNETSNKIITDLKEIYKDVGGIGKNSFDFIISQSDNIYLCKVNIYNTSGSKLKYPFEEYVTQDKDDKYTFVWIVDGDGCLNKNCTEISNVINEACKKNDHIYNLCTFENFVKNLK